MFYALEGVGLEISYRNIPSLVWKDRILLRNLQTGRTTVSHVVLEVLE